MIIQLYGKADPGLNFYSCDFSDEAIIIAFFITSLIVIAIYRGKKKNK
jgi:hypothetical protein